MVSLLILWLNLQKLWVLERAPFASDAQDAFEKAFARQNTSLRPWHTPGLDEVHYWSTIITFPTRVTSSIMITVLQLSSCELWLSGLIPVQVPTWGIILVSNAIPFVETLEKFGFETGERYLNKLPDIIFWKLAGLHFLNINC